MKDLFIGNLNFRITEHELRELLEPFGEISRVQMPTDRETGRLRGFAFVEMPNDEEAAKVIAELDGREVKGRNLKVNEARPRSRPPQRSSGRPRGEGGFSQEDYRGTARQPREPRW